MTDSGRGAFGRPLPWACAGGVTPRVTTAVNATAVWDSVRISSLGLRCAPGRGAGGRRRGRRVDLRTQLAHGLPEAETVNGHRFLQIREGDALVLRRVQGGDELALVAEAGGRLIERHTGWQHRAKTRQLLRVA